MTQIEQIIWHEFDCDNPPVDGTYLLNYQFEKMVSDGVFDYVKRVGEAMFSDETWCLSDNTFIYYEDIIAWAERPKGWQDDTDN